MKNGLEFSEGVAVGATAGTIVCVFFIFIVLHVDGSTASIAAEMFATIGALFGAWLALHGLRRQIQSNIDLQSEADRRRLLAARSVLPLALAGLADAAGQNLRRHFPDDASYGGKVAIEYQPVDVGAIGALKECIEFAPDEIGVRIAKIIAAYQILNSRQQDGKYVRLPLGGGDWLSNEHRTMDDAINWSVMYAMVSSLFDFARGVDVQHLLPLNQAQIDSAFRNNRIQIEGFPKLVRMIAERAQSGRLEMNFER